MRIKNSVNWVQYSISNSLLGASFILVIAFLIRFAVHPLIEPYAPFHFFILACMLIAYMYGYKIGLLSVLISTAVGGYYFIKPYNSLGPLDEINPTDWVQFFNFGLVTIASIFVIEKLQRNVSERTLLLKVMQSRYRIELLRKNQSQVDSLKRKNGIA